MGSSNWIKLLVFTLVVASSRCLAAPDVPKVCPPEPTLGPAEECPAVCTGGCEYGTCLVVDPNDNVICPNNLPCKIVCTSISCYQRNTTFTCSKNASCDILFPTDKMSAMVAIDCNDTPFSCNVICTESSYLATIACNNSISCNCNRGCTQKFTCISGVNCPQDKCFFYVNEVNQCTQGIYGGTMNSLIDAGGNCNCSCKDPNKTKLLWTKPTTPFYVCIDPPRYCSLDSDCGYIANGSCTLGNNIPECHCYNPKAGGKCTTSGCPQCKNNAFCGNTTATPCVCTGAWTGPDCSIPLTYNITGARAVRCSATVSPVTVSPSALTATQPLCPSPCTYCSVDSDGTPVCVVRLPPPSMFLIDKFDITCPTTHRCIGYCVESSSCVGDFRCTGDLPCDLASNGNSFVVTLHCNSSSICRGIMGNLAYEGLSVPNLSRGPRNLVCSYPGGPCLCETGNMWAPCLPGTNCAGDPCAGQVCTSVGSLPAFDAETNTCSCGCVPGYHYSQTIPCLVINSTADCASNCTPGICKNGECWCPPGRSGADCSVVDTCVVTNDSNTCPSICSWCEAGVCFLYSRSVEGLDRNVCPLGWPCVFICRGDDCSKVEFREFTCPAGSGPCELWCWDTVESPLLRISKEQVEYSPCTNKMLRCEDGGVGCRARCTSRLWESSIYSQTRSLRGVICGDTRVNDTSLDPLDRCNSCGSNTCYIAEHDQCYLKANYTSWSGLFGFLPECGSDASGKQLELVSNNISLSCDCVCPQNYTLVNGSCSAQFCDPSCQNSGVCTITVDGQYQCRCFKGWNGKDCTSRCFFPVMANVTLCEAGLYRISGELALSNVKLDLFREVADLVNLEIEGSLSASSSSILNVGLADNATITGSLHVGESLILSSNSTLESNIIFQNGNPVSALINVTNTVSLTSGKLQISTNFTQFSGLLSAASPTLSVEIMQFGSFSSDEGAITLFNIEDSGSCTPIRASTSSSQQGGRGSLSILFSLDETACSPTSPSADSSSPEQVQQPQGELPTSSNAVGVGIGVAVAFVAVAGIALLVASALIPSFRSKIFPFLSRSNATHEAELDHEEEPASESRSTNRRTWVQAKPKEID